MATDTKAPGPRPTPPTSQPPRKPDEETDEERIYRNVSFASTDYIPWVLGRLRLGNADLSRMNSAGVPVLRSHDGDSPVGRVTSVRKDEMAGLWKSDWVLPKISSNARSFEQLDSGLLRGISVGGHLDVDSIVIDNEDAVDNIGDLLLTADWMLVEESLTPIPADVRAGIDRSAGAYVIRGQPLFDLLISPDGISTPDSSKLRAHIGNLMRTHNQNITLRREAQMTTTQVPQDAIERAIADQLARSETLKSLTGLPDKMDKLIADQQAEAQQNMEYRAKLDKIQYQPQGAVLQMGNWRPGVDRVLDIGKIIRLTSQDDLGFPTLDRSGSTFEESFLEQQELEPAGRSVAARIPFAAFAERARELTLQRNTVSGGAGARQSDVTVLGDGGLLLSTFSPILGAMNVRAGLSGGQKLPYFSAQGSAAGAAEAADIPITTWTVDNTELLPVSIASAFDISSSLRGVDDGTFEGLVFMGVQRVAGEELVDQVLDGAGSSSNEIAGLYGRVSTSSPDKVHEYGAAQTDFTRADVLAVKNLVALAKTDGSAGSFILSSTLWQLCEGTLRGGSASDRYLLESMPMEGMGMMGGMNGMMGMMEGRPAYHYADFGPTGVTDAGLYAKLDRVTVFLWGSSFTLEQVPVLARKDQWKLCVEANIGVIQPDHNLAAIRQT